MASSDKEHDVIMQDLSSKLTWGPVKIVEGSFSKEHMKGFLLPSGMIRERRNRTFVSLVGNMEGITENNCQLQQQFGCFGKLQVKTSKINRR